MSQVDAAEPSRPAVEDGPAASPTTTTLTGFWRRAADHTKFAKRLKQIVAILIHPVRHVEYARLVQRVRRIGLAEDLLVDFKYLGTYLSEDLGREMRRRIITHHYVFLADKLETLARGRSWTRGFVVWTRRDEAAGHDFSIVLEQSRLSPMEGESQLVFVMDGAPLCTLTFSFVHGSHIGVACEDAMYIGGVQGGSHCRQEIRLAAKANGEIAPSTMLLLTAQALVEALGVGYILGTSSHQHPAASYAGEKIAFSYDSLWIDAGARRTDRGLFIVVPGSDGPERDEVRGSHRSRTRRRRRLKAAIKTDIRRSIEDWLAPASSRLPSVRPGCGSRPGHPDASDHARHAPQGTMSSSHDQGRLARESLAAPLDPTHA